MPTVWIPPLLQDLTDGREVIEADGASLGALVDDLDARFPGLAHRLLDDGKLRPQIAVTIDGVVAGRRRGTPIDPGAEVHFVPAMSGG